MRDLLFATLPLFGVVVGACLQHLFARSKYRDEQLRLLRQASYADYLRGVAALAQNRADVEADLLLVADAKSRIAIYGSSGVIEKLAAFEAIGPELTNESAREAFVSIIDQMRRDGDSISVGRDNVHLVLFGNKK
jgi:hypothetical protein